MDPSDHRFAGSIPRLYDDLLVPMLFDPYAEDLAARVAARAPGQVLELACGTGALTRQLAARVPVATRLVATDLNQPMLDQAARRGTTRPVEWRQADAMRLPFEDGTFDVVVCQFGAMFFPDKPAAFAEARRVLRPGGAFLFNVWGRVEDNEFADVVTEALATVFPDDPPRFMARTPHGYFEQPRVAADLAGGGFTTVPEWTTLTRRSVAPSADVVGVAYCQATPLRNEIEARDAARLEDATAVATAALRRRFGSGRVDGKMEAHVIAAPAATGTAA